MTDAATIHAGDVIRKNSVTILISVVTTTLGVLVASAAGFLFLGAMRADLDATDQRHFERTAIVDRTFHGLLEADRVSLTDRADIRSKMATLEERLASNIVERQRLAVEADKRDDRVRRLEDERVTVTREIGLLREQIANQNGQLNEIKNMLQRALTSDRASPRERSLLEGRATR